MIEPLFGARFSFSIVKSYIFALALLLGACDKKPVNILESRDGSEPSIDADDGLISRDASPDADASEDGNEDASDGGDPQACNAPNPRCFEYCYSDIVVPANCVNDAWTCPQGWHRDSDRDTVCVGKITGPCRNGDTCDEINGVCGADGRCWIACTDGVGRCREYNEAAGCCTSTPVDGLCGIPPFQFHVCPLGSMEAANCMTGDASLCVSPDASDDGGADAADSGVGQDA